jgi:hypothetical protein
MHWLRETTVRLRKLLPIGAATAIAAAVMGLATPMLIGSATAAAAPPRQPGVVAAGTLSETPTTTSLSANPATAEQRELVSLTATETPVTAGSVQFFQDGVSLGSSLNVNSSGVATMETNTLLPSAPTGTELTATFTPSDPSFTGSTGALAYTVNPVAIRPQIEGHGAPGATVICIEPGLDPGVSVRYRWLVNGSTAATGPRFLVPWTLYKKQVQCRASVHDGSGPSSSMSGFKRVLVRGAALTPTMRPTLSGLHKVGRTERVNPGRWADPGVGNVNFRYQWLLNGKPIRGATWSTFTPTRGDARHRLRCRVTAGAEGFANGSASTGTVFINS